MKANYDHKPNPVEAVGDGRYFYRWDIVPVENGFSCNEVIVNELSSSEIKRSVISEIWGHDVENKLLNDYYAALEGILPEDYKTPYLEFLIARKLIKSQIDEIISNL